MRLPCNCCRGVETSTPGVIWNRPGLPALRYRVGTHNAFLASMEARLSSLVLDGVGDAPYPRPLDELRTRDPSDPSIALLDAWASVADVLTFYQERLANEGYLETATERRSVLELARLVGYRLRPGVAASVKLAFTLDTGYRTEIPAGTRAQSVPAPGETMQSFETSKQFVARTEWNDLRPRLGRPQVFDRRGAAAVHEIYLTGTATKLSKGDPVLLVVGVEDADRVLRFVDTVELQEDHDRTKVTLRPRPLMLVEHLLKAAILDARTEAPQGANADRVLARLAELERVVTTAGSVQSIADELDDAIAEIEPIRADAEARGFTKLSAWTGTVVSFLETHRALAIEPDGTPPAAIERRGVGALLDELSVVPTPPVPAVVDVQRVFARGGDATPRALTIFRPVLGDLLYPALRRLPPPQPDTLEVYALRVTASPFGYNAPKIVTDDSSPPKLLRISRWTDWPPDGESGKTLFLDAAYADERGDGYAVITGASGPGDEQALSVTGVETVSRTAYGISTRSTRLSLADSWWEPGHQKDITILRHTVVYAGSERLGTADAPIPDDVGGQEIELVDLLEGLEAGRAVIVEGERTARGLGATGVRLAELATVAGVRQGVAKLHPGDPKSIDLPGDRVHTTLLLTKPLAYTYVRETVSVRANVADATHGESRAELLGSGDGRKGSQSFPLRQPPLTFVSAPTATGAASTLSVRVDEVRWHEADSFLDLGPRDRSYVTAIDDDGKTTVTFGDGTRGARPPTGINNVVATYRTGIGKAGNVKADAITLLAAKPLGVKEVVNPLAANGGADPESRDQARRNVPTAVAALDRLVSVQDYEDFARVFAGVGKASAVRLPVGRRNTVHVTIAGADDIPIAPDSDLFANLLESFRRYGDPLQPVQVALRGLVVVILTANLRIDPDYDWVAVESNVRAALHDTFGFEQRELAQPLAGSAVVATIQNVAGVVYVDLDGLAGLNEQDAIALLTSPQADAAPALTLAAQPFRLRRAVEALPARIRDGSILPAQLAYVTPELENTVVLTEIVA